MIQFSCHHCGNPMHTESVAAGFKFPCPLCNTIIKVPIHSSTHIDCLSIIGSEVTKHPKHPEFNSSKKHFCLDTLNTEQLSSDSIYEDYKKKLEAWIAHNNCSVREEWDDYDRYL